MQVLLVTRGHPFDREAFLSMFDALPGLEITHVEHPAASSAMFGDDCSSDVMVFYDMPGVGFTGGDPPVDPVHPSDDVVDGWRRLVDRGQPLVFLHHAIAGWPAWPFYAELVGGRFHYKAAPLRGVGYPDSGYRLDVTHRVSCVSEGHPICEGLEEGFELTDELYLCPVFEDSVEPLLRSDFEFVHENFYSADAAVRRRYDDAEGWSHPDSSSLVGWTKSAGRSPVVYLQPGDGPATYENPAYRRLLSNAIAWAASADAASWARGRG